MTTSQSATPWILACDGSNPEFPFGFACTGYGKKCPVKTPIPVSEYLSKAVAFMRQHQWCAVL